jgi:HK97 family phage major capsid protein
MPRSAKAIADQIEETWARADREGRDLTAAERSQVEQLIEAAKSQHQVEQDIKAMGDAIGGPLLSSLGVNANGSAAFGGGPGDVFVQSKQYQQIKDPAGRGQTWTTGPIEVSSVPFQTKGTLLEPTAGGLGGGLVPPVYQPGVVETLFEPLGVADVFGSSQVTASQVRYVVEGTATNAAAGVAEAGEKPESTLGLSETTEAIRKIATVLPVSDELLEDAVSIQTYLNSRLSLFVKLEEERQLLRGAGGGSNELVGVFGRSDINQYTKAAADDNATALAKVIANTRGSSYLQPDAVLLHPNQWLNMRLLRDGTGGTVGQFVGGGPFSGAYGAGGAPGAVRRVDLEHPGRPLHRRWSRHGPRRQLRPGRAHLAQGRRFGGGQQQPRRLLRPQPEHAARRGEARARRVPAGRVHGGPRPDLTKSAHFVSGSPGLGGTAEFSPRLAVPPAHTERGDKVEFTETQAEILTNAWLLAREGKGQVVTAEALPDTVELAEPGWLERRMEDNGHASWWWTPQAETALDVNRLHESVEDGRTSATHPEKNGCVYTEPPGPSSAPAPRLVDRPLPPDLHRRSGPNVRRGRDAPLPDDDRCGQRLRQVRRTVQGGVVRRRRPRPRPDSRRATAT